MNAPEVKERSAADAELLLETLADWRERCDRLDDLRQEQAAAIAAGDFGRVVGVASRRDEVLADSDAVAALRSLRENWPSTSAALPAGRRDAARSALKAIEGRLAELALAQQADVDAASSARDRTLAELKKVRTAGGVHAAYRDHLGQSSSRRLDLDG